MYIHMALCLCLMSLQKLILYDAVHPCIYMYIYYTYVGVQPKEICLDVMNGPAPTHIPPHTNIRIYVLRILCIVDVIYNI